MNINDLLKEHADWLKTAARKATSVKEADAYANFPEELRERRMTDLSDRIADLERRKSEMIANYDNAIAREQHELEGLKTSAGAVQSEMMQAAAAQKLKKQSRGGKTK